MQNSKCGVTIPAIYACGMHHYGTSAFKIDIGYILQREPSNVYDPNAIVVTRKNKPMRTLCVRKATVLYQPWIVNCLQVRST